VNIINDDSDLEEESKGGTHRRKSSAQDEEAVRKMLLDEDLKAKNEKYKVGEVFLEQEEHYSEEDSFDGGRAKKRPSIKVKNTDETPRGESDRPIQIDDDSDEDQGQYPHM